MTLSTPSLSTASLKQPFPSSSSSSANSATAGHPITSYDRFLSDEGKARQPGPLWALAVKDVRGSKEDQIKPINFSGGLPHPSTFPISQTSFTFPWQCKTVVTSSPIMTSAGASTDLVRAADGTMDLPLDQMLQYAPSDGFTQLQAFLREHVQRSFQVPYESWDVSLSLGNTDGIDVILRTLCQRGDNVLMEEFCYTGTLDAMRPMGLTPVPVKLDSEGLCPQAMDEVLSSWSTATQGPKPRIAILVPTGQNPTGGSMSLQRRMDVYEVARKHDLLIIADEPYARLVLNPSDDGRVLPPAPSFLSVDPDGRVIELSTFSKIVAPGLRCGWIVAPRQLLERFNLRNQVTNQSPSGLSVGLLTSFFGSIGGQVGWERYLENAAVSYSARARCMDRVFKRYLPLEVCDWTLPKAGMFIFLRCRLASHPRLAELGPDGCQSDIFARGSRLGVTVVPSSLFKADPKTPTTADNVFFRCSFSYHLEDETEEGARRLGQAIRESFAG